MGVFKEYIAGIVSRELTIYWYGACPCRSFKALDGTEITQTKYHGSDYYGYYHYLTIYDVNAQQYYAAITPIATEDTIEDRFVLSSDTIYNSSKIYCIKVGTNYVDIDPSTLPFEYVVTQDTTYDPNKTYYTYDEETQEYTIFTGTEFEEEVVYYEKIIHLISEVVYYERILGYHQDDYQITPIGTTEFDRAEFYSSVLERNIINLSIRITNTDNLPIIVKCIKFKKEMSNYGTVYDTLAFAYYLDEDEWITIPSGETAFLTLAITSVDEV